MADNGEIIIEMSDANNSNIFFDPLGKTLRGALDVSKVASKGKALAVGNVPGLRVGLTLRAKRARVFDPLGLPNEQARLDHINEARGRTFEKAIKPCTQETYTNMTDNELATFLYWMRRYVQEKKAVVVTGSAKLDGFDLPGDPIIDNYHDSNHKAPRYKSEFDELYHSGGNARRGPMVPVEKQG